MERKVLFTLDYMNGLPTQIKDLFRVAFASVMVDFSNYSYEPSLGTRPGAGKALVDDADVAVIVANKLRDMMEDIAEVQNGWIPSSSGMMGGEPPVRENYNPGWQVHERSFFEVESCLDAASVDLVVTSPPYMNNYHYVRNSRPQLFWKRVDRVAAGTETIGNRKLRLSSGRRSGAAGRFPSFRICRNWSRISRQSAR